VGADESKEMQKKKLIRARERGNKTEKESKKGLDVLWHELSLTWWLAFSLGRGCL
jgi:hypothetical protein